MSKPLLQVILYSLGVLAVVIVLAGLARLSAAATASETYRLVQAIGNSEKVIAKDLEKGECARRKREHIQVAEGLGVHSERLGIGAITCLPESFFQDR